MRVPGLAVLAQGFLWLMACAAIGMLGYWLAAWHGPVAPAPDQVGTEAVQIRQALLTCGIFDIGKRLVERGSGPWVHTPAPASASAAGATTSRQPSESAARRDRTPR